MIPDRYISQHWKTSTGGTQLLHTHATFDYYANPIEDIPPEDRDGYERDARVLLRMQLAYPMTELIQQARVQLDVVRAAPYRRAEDFLDLLKTFQQMQDLIVEGPDGDT